MVNQADAARPDGSTRCKVDPTTILASGCRISRSDTAGKADPIAGLWGSIECAAATRYEYMRGNGDRGRTATGARQHNDAYRRLRVISGDQFFGQRCELGRNSSTFGVNRAGQTNGTFDLYRDGQHRITFVSERYPKTFSRDAGVWQAVMQMKQAQPADNGGGGPILELDIDRGRLRLINRWQQVWSTRAPVKNHWIRYALDVRYSTSADTGRLKLYVDRNSDGDALDRGEQSPLLRLPTMLAETDGPNGTSDGYAPGDPIPDHLRVGIYTSPDAPCAPPGGCAVDVDDVQVVAPKG